MQKVLIELSQLRTTAMGLSFEQLQLIDRLTHEYGNSYSTNQYIHIHQMWTLISQTLMFWKNAYLLISQTKHNETKLQALVLMHDRIKLNWNHEEPATRMEVKNYLCGQCHSFDGTSLTTPQKSLFRKTNSLIVEILKYEWAGQWKTFIPNICQVALSNELPAENYFDLLKVIFQQIFAQKSHLLTSSQRTKLYEQVSIHFITIQKLFQQYMDIQKHKNKSLILNVFSALESILPFMPLYYVHFGFIINRLVLYASTRQYSILALNSLKIVFELRSDESTLTYIDKIKQRKYELIFNLLQRTSQLLSKEFNRLVWDRMIQILQIFYRQHSQFMENEEETLGRKIAQWLLKINPQQCYQMIFILQKIVPYLSPQQRQPIIKYIICLAPCPHSQFYLKCKIFQPFSQSQHSYSELLSLTISTHSQLFSKLILQIRIPSTMDELRVLCRHGWCMYHFNTLKHPLALTNLGLRFLLMGFRLDQSLKQQLLLIQNSKQYHHPQLIIYHKTQLALRSIFMMLLCNQHLARDKERMHLFLKLVKQSLKEEENIIDMSMETLKHSMKYLDEAYTYDIVNALIKQTQHYVNRAEIILKSAEAVRQWLIIHKSSNLKIVHRLIQDHQHKFYQLCGRNVKEGTDQVQWHHANKLLIEETASTAITLLKIFTLMLDTQAPIYEHFQQAFKSYFIIVTHLCRFQGQQFMESYVEMQIALMRRYIPLQEISPSLYHFLKLYQKCMYMGVILKYFGVYVGCTHANSAMVQVIVGRVYEHDFTLQNPSMLQFLQQLVSSPICLQLSQKLLSTTLCFVLDLCQYGQNVGRSYDFLSKILNISINDNKIWPYMLDIILQTFKTMIKHIKQFAHHEELSEVLALEVFIVMNESMILCEGQMNSNLEEVHLKVMALMEGLYGGQQELIEGISAQLNTILHTASVEEVKRKIGDLLVVMQRGYL